MRPVPPAPRAPARLARPAALAGAALLAAAAASAMTACNTDRLLDVTTPSRLGAGQYLVPQNAGLIVSSAAADFECAFGAYVVSSGLTAGELADASQTASRWSLDRRDFLPTDALYSTATCQGLGTYTPVSTARFTADQAYQALTGWTDAQVPNRQRLLAQSALYAGYSLVLLGEGFCSAAINQGAELTTAQVLDSAEARFTAALAAAALVPASDTLARTVTNAAYVGRARVRLDRGNKAGAAADAALVPLGFALNATAASNSDRRVNRVFSENNTGNGGVTVAPAYRALTVQGAPDPRVRVTDANALAADQQNRIFRQTKYAGLDAPTPIATGVEARLILAEAQGAAGGGVATLNALRARAGVALPPLTAAEAADFQNTVLEERRRELFLQGNRLYDLRRATLTPTPAPNSAYPKGGTYAGQLCYPLPDAERAANPNA